METNPKLLLNSTKQSVLLAEIQSVTSIYSFETKSEVVTMPVD